MNDREIFRKNLNHYLAVSGKLQKDLAEYVGAKTTTVSGWTRGISYPRADAMEKIAAFFGIPTSRLVGEIEPSHPPEKEYYVYPTVSTSEARIISGGVDRMPPEKREQALKILQAAFIEYADFFKEETDK